VRLSFRHDRGPPLAAHATACCDATNPGLYTRPWMSYV
jgi:hypothetical protein